MAVRHVRCHRLASILVGNLDRTNLTPLIFKCSPVHTQYTINHMTTQTSIRTWKSFVDHNTHSMEWMFYLNLFHISKGKALPKEPFMWWDSIPPNPPMGPSDPGPIGNCFKKMKKVIVINGNSFYLALLINIRDCPDFFPEVETSQVTFKAVDSLSVPPLSSLPSGWSG